MMSLQEEILSLLDDEAKIVDAQWVEDMQQRYPYFSLPAMLMLKRNGEIDSELRQKLAQNLALNASDRDALSLVVDVDGDYWAHFYPQEERQPQVSTNDAISTFLDNYGTNDPKEDELLERLIFNPTPDYAQLLASEEERSVPENVDLSDPDSQDSLINAFILKSREHQGHFPAINEELALDKKEEPQEVDTTPVSQPEERADDSMLSESLAKIYIKQRKYSKAYEIIRNLSLNFPEKSIYFADQLRFLQKLMLNQRYLDAKKAENNKN